MDLSCSFVSVGLSNFSDVLANSLLRVGVYSVRASRTVGTMVLSSVPFASLLSAASVAFSSLPVVVCLNPQKKHTSFTTCTRGREASASAMVAAVLAVVGSELVKT